MFIGWGFSRMEKTTEGRMSDIEGSRSVGNIQSGRQKDERFGENVQNLRDLWDSTKKVINNSCQWIPRKSVGQQNTREQSTSTFVIIMNGFYNN